MNEIIEAGPVIDHGQASLYIQEVEEIKRIIELFEFKRGPLGMWWTVRCPICKTRQGITKPYYDDSPFRLACIGCLQEQRLATKWKLIAVVKQ